MEPCQHTHNGYARAHWRFRFGFVCFFASIFRLSSGPDDTGWGNLGHALETAVYLELERRGCETDYIRTRDGYEVNFFVRNPEGDTALIQDCTDVSDPALMTGFCR